MVINSLLNWLKRFRFGLVNRYFWHDSTKYDYMALRNTFTIVTLMTHKLNITLKSKLWALYNEKTSLKIYTVMFGYTLIQFGFGSIFVLVWLLWLRFIYSIFCFLLFYMMMFYWDVKYHKKIYEVNYWKLFLVGSGWTYWHAMVGVQNDLILNVFATFVQAIIQGLQNNVYFLLIWYL